MSPGAVVFVAGLLVAIVGAIALMVVRFTVATKIDWRPLGIDAVQVYTPPGLDTDKLIAALAKAKVCLCAVWDPARIQAVTRDLKIYVHAEKVWIDGWGRKVAGISTGDAVEVGSDLSALCHELAHVLQRRLDNRVEEGHVGWMANGIEAAVSAYLAWLASA